MYVSFEGVIDPRISSLTVDELLCELCWFKRKIARGIDDPHALDIIFLEKLLYRKLLRSIKIYQNTVYKKKIEWIVPAKTKQLM